MVKNKRQSVREVKRNKAINLYGYDVLASIHKLCGAKAIDYWLYGGTLLGMIRDKGFIANDTDIDIGLWDTPENHKLLDEELPKNGFTKLFDFYVGDKVLENRFERDGVGVDFWFFNKSRDSNRGANNLTDFSYASGFNTDKEGLYVVEDHYKLSAFDKLNNIEVNNTMLSVPADYEYILEAFYGDWRTPITKTDGYVQFKNPNQVHRYDLRAERKHYAKSSIQVTLGERIKHLFSPSS